MQSRIQAFYSCIFSIFGTGILHSDLKEMEFVLSCHTRKVMAKIVNLSLSQLIVCRVLYLFSSICRSISFKNYPNLLITAQNHGVNYRF